MYIIKYEHKCSCNQLKNLYFLKKISLQMFERFIIPQNILIVSFEKILCILFCFDIMYNEKKCINNNYIKIR